MNPFNETHKRYSPVRWSVPSDSHYKEHQMIYGLQLLVLWNVKNFELSEDILARSFRSLVEQD